MITKIQTAKEIKTAYGMSAGVHCPYCSIRDYPKSDPYICPKCGNEYRTPKGYSHRTFRPDLRRNNNGNNKVS